MIRTRLETAILKLRLFTDDDLQIMFELNSDPEIIKYAEAELQLNWSLSNENFTGGS